VGILRRQRIVLSILDEAGRPLERTLLVKLAFLLRFETSVREEATFYDFVPYKYGPFSFALYRELRLMEQRGYVISAPAAVAISDQGRRHAWRASVRAEDPVLQGVRHIVASYGRHPVGLLLQHVYERYPWYASRSELAGVPQARSRRGADAAVAVYTVGYEGSSIDAFLERLLRAGITAIIDVRANAVSRKYGFAGRTLAGIAQKLDVHYAHVPALGVDSRSRRNLSGEEDRRLLLDEYQQQVLPKRAPEIRRVASSLEQRPSALLCMERDPRRCHRSRLASVLAERTGLPITHL